MCTQSGRAARKIPFLVSVSPEIPNHKYELTSASETVPALDELTAISFDQSASGYQEGKVAPEKSSHIDSVMISI